MQSLRRADWPPLTQVKAIYSTVLHVIRLIYFIERGFIWSFVIGVINLVSLENTVKIQLEPTGRATQFTHHLYFPDQSFKCFLLENYTFINNSSFGQYNLHKIIKAIQVPTKKTNHKWEFMINKRIHEGNSKKITSKVFECGPILH